MTSTITTGPTAPRRKVARPGVEVGGSSTAYPFLCSKGQITPPPTPRGLGCERSPRGVMLRGSVRGNGVPTPHTLSLWGLPLTCSSVGQMLVPSTSCPRSQGGFGAEPGSEPRCPESPPRTTTTSLPCLSVGGWDIILVSASLGGGLGMGGSGLLPGAPLLCVPSPAPQPVSAGYPMSSCSQLCGRLDARLRGAWESERASICVFCPSGAA